MVVTKGPGKPKPPDPEDVKRAKELLRKAIEAYKALGIDTDEIRKDFDKLCEEIPVTEQEMVYEEILEPAPPSGYPAEPAPMITRADSVELIDALEMMRQS